MALTVYNGIYDDMLLMYDLLHGVLRCEKFVAFGKIVKAAKLISNYESGSVESTSYSYFQDVDIEETPTGHPSDIARIFATATVCHLFQLPFWSVRTVNLVNIHRIPGMSPLSTWQDAFRNVLAQEGLVGILRGCGPYIFVSMALEWRPLYNQCRAALGKSTLPSDEVPSLSDSMNSFCKPDIGTTSLLSSLSLPSLTAPHLAKQDNNHPHRLPLGWFEKYIAVVWNSLPISVILSLITHPFQLIALRQITTFDASKSIFSQANNSWMTFIDIMMKEGFFGFFKGFQISLLSNILLPDSLLNSNFTSFERGILSQVFLWILYGIVETVKFRCMLPDTASNGGLGIGLSFSALQDMISKDGLQSIICFGRISLYQIPISIGIHLCVRFVTSVLLGSTSTRRKQAKARVAFLDRYFAGSEVSPTRYGKKPNSFQVV